MAGVGAEIELHHPLERLAHTSQWHPCSASCLLASRVSGPPRQAYLLTPTTDLAPSPPPAASVDAAATPVVAEELPPAEPFPISALTPRDIVVKSIGSSEATLTFSLPPTSTRADTVDVRVLVRPAKAYREANLAATAVQKQINQKSMEHNMQMAKNRAKPGFNQHEAFVDFNKVQMVMRNELNTIWDAYTLRAKELLNLEVAGPFMQDGWYLYADGQFTGVENSRSNIPSTLSKLTSESNNQVDLTHLASNYFFESVFQARPSTAPAREEDQGGGFEWSPFSERVSFSTKSAPWQLALEKAGLRQLIEPFSNRGFDSFASWLQFGNDTELKMEFGIDNAMEQLLQEILSSNGVITPAEQAKIDREREEMRGFVGTLLQELSVTKTALGMGDAVLDVATGKFGVLTTNPSPKGTVSVRWEDARTKDPSNSLVQEGVAVSSLKRTTFTLFMSHAQAEAQNQVAHLSVLLRDKDAKIWFDMDSERLEARDMVRGIANSSTFLLYLTRSYLDRYFCRMELSIAKALEKPLVIVFEPDERFGGTSDYVQLVNQVTQKYPEFRSFLLGSEAIPMARRAFQRRAVVDEVCKRAGFSSPTTSSAAVAASPQAAKQQESAGRQQLADVHSTILDLKMDINDLKAENKELRELVEALVRRLDG
ncbi:hypothetical protein BASA81_004228 [Batrachochytrium salamandrivorans]|nr:hypothetical protein BASA81_004228 [Batrachochytrium salamandrivorans]